MNTADINPPSSHLLSPATLHKKHIMMNIKKLVEKHWDELLLALSLLGALYFFLKYTGTL